MTVTLLRNGAVYSPADPFATAMVVENGTVAWIGAEGAADAHADVADRVVDLRGALVAPAFVDAHVHTTATGLALTGLDLTGVTSLAAALDAVAAYATAHGLTGAGGVVLGHGWDDTAWPEGRPPTAAELDRATGGAAVYLTRADAHSAVASNALLARVPGLAGLAGHRDGGPYTADAHHALRAAAHAAIGPDLRRRAQRAARERAAGLGIGTLHECGGPEIAGEEDLRALLALAAAETGPDVVAYWGRAVTTAKEAAELVADLGVHGLGGDLFADGSLGSRTACLHDPYADDAGHGLAHLTAEEIAAHVVACTEAGVQAGFHAIGDAAVDAVVAGFRAAADRCGPPAVRLPRHRVEHALMAGDDAVTAFAELGLVASVQPAFDAAWGGEDGMYARRLGPGRARGLNPYAALNRAGVPLAFGSDAPVTPLDPWGTVRAAAFHRTPEQRVSARAAFLAHTRGGHRAVGRDDLGVLVPGARADYAVWAAGDLVVQAPDGRLSAWSTDPGSGTPGLPDLEPGLPLPRCLATVVRGRVLHEDPALGA